MDEEKSERVIVTESGRCSWGNCIFCSFSKKPNIMCPDFTRLKYELDSKLTRKFDIVKYLNSGSFLDELQIPVDFQRYLINKCIGLGVTELVIESLPMHITRKNLNVIKDANKNQKLKISFALGLEIADDTVLKKICKGFNLSDYLAAVNLLKKEGFYVRTYLMANLPYVDEIAKSLDESIRFAEENSDTVALINTYAYGYAPLFDLWLKGRWKPLDRHEFDALVKKYEHNKKVEIYFDDYISYPRFKDQEKLIGANIENLISPIYDVWQDYIVRFYKKPEIKMYALFLPCSFRKPYSSSKTHREILKRIISLPFYSNLHQLMISNPGVIPREYEGKYPFAHYDWPEWEETPSLKEKYIEVTQKRIELYLSSHRYKKVFAYFKPTSESYIALKSACSKLNISLISCTDEMIYNSLKDDSSNLLINRRVLDGFVKCLRDNI